MRLFSTARNMAALLGDSFQHGARLENEGGEGDSAKVGTRSELTDNVGEDYYIHLRQNIRFF